MRLFFTTIIVLISAACSAQDIQGVANSIRREIAGEIKSFRIPQPPIAKSKELQVVNASDTIKIRIYYPNNGKKKLPIIYNVHGGALVAGDLNTHDNICRILSLRTSSIVIAVDYRKPPEFPYPAGMDDCMAVLNWIKKNGQSLNADITKLTLLGDSGGGLLIATLLVNQNGKIPVNNVVLVNPAVDLRNAGDGMYGLVTKMYLNGKSPEQAIISPILGKDVSFFPPTLVITCEKDILKSQGTAFFHKLKSANVKVEITDIANEDHLGGLWAAGHPRAVSAIDKTVAFIKTARKN